MLEAVLGQPEGVAYLRKVAEGALSLPLLLVGPQGVGRRLAVIETAKAVFGDEQHYGLAVGRHPDLHVLQPEEGKDIKIEAVRNLIDETRALPSWAPLKFFIVDGADRLTTGAANALLKVLEERPPKMRFFLLSEQLVTVMPTIRSRCAIVPFRRLPEDLLLSKLLEITEDETKARVCARMSEGSLGRATRCLVSGQLVSRDEMSMILLSASRKDLFAMFSAVDKVADLQLGLLFLGQLLRDVLVVEVAPTKVIHLDIVTTLKQLAAQVSASTVHALLAELRRLRERAEAPINLGFHLKSVLASV